MSHFKDLITEFSKRLEYAKDAHDGCWEMARKIDEKVPKALGWPRELISYFWIELTKDPLGRELETVHEERQIVRAEKFGQDGVLRLGFRFHLPSVYSEGVEHRSELLWLDFQWRKTNPMPQCACHRGALGDLLSRNLQEVSVSNGAPMEWFAVTGRCQGAGSARRHATCHSRDASDVDDP